MSVVGKVGSISVESVGGSYRLRFAFNGKRYALGTGIKISSIGLNSANALALKVEGDILTGNFDASLDKYRPAKKHSVKQQIETNADKLDAFMALKKLSLRKSSYKRFESHYRMTRVWIGQHNNELPSDNDCRVLFASYKARFKTSMLKDRIDFLSQFWDYCNGKISTNIWRILINAVKGKGQDIEKPEPFTKEERDKILQVFLTDQYLRPWHPVTLFMMLTGCRPSEAYALVWTDFNFTKRQVSISKGSVDGVIDKTKTGKNRTIPISDFIVDMLRNLTLSLPDDSTSSDLVFPFPGTSKPITTKLYLTRWRQALKKAGVPYRKPYSMRHTYITESLTQGILPLQVAKLVGNSPKVIFDHYENLTSDLSSSIPNM